MPGLNLRDDLEGVAALTACMDAVVAPSSFPMMMAGALGRPAFHYIRRNWTMLGTDGSPWFPQMRCYLIDDTGTNSGFWELSDADLRAFLPQQHRRPGKTFPLAAVPASTTGHTHYINH